MIYVYAIVGAGDGPEAPGPGVGDAPVALHVGGLLAVVYSCHEGPAPRPTRENALRHGRVVEEWMGSGALLPVRFGTTFRDEAALDAALARNRDRLSAGLERVRGHSEWGVRVLWQPEPELEAAPADPLIAQSGREYLLARAARQHRRERLHERAERLANRIHAPLSALASASTRRVLASPELLMSGAYLVPHHRVAEFREAVRALAAEHTDLRVLGTGPWPPYHFTPPLDTAEVAHA
jgi:hypothetical protein